MSQYAAVFCSVLQCCNAFSLSTIHTSVCLHTHTYTHTLSLSPSLSLSLSLSLALSRALSLSLSLFLLGKAYTYLRLSVLYP